MGTRKVLDVGNCSPDHAAICHMLRSTFDVDVTQAHSGREALEQLQQGHFDLVLINRKLDRDYSDGVEILRQIKTSQDLQDTPVMLITNYEDHQQAAVALGAELGFGKLELHATATREKLSAFLS